MRSPSKSVLTFSALTLSLLTSAVVLAQTAPPPAKSRETMQARMEERLKAADTDKDGLISKAEAEKNLPGLARHFDEVDTNKDGLLSTDELKAMRDKMRANWAQHRHHHAAGGPGFMHADENHDGVVTRAEAEKASQKIMQDFDAADTNKDGQLSADEVKAMREKMWAAHKHDRPHDQARDQQTPRPPQPGNSK